MCLYLLLSSTGSLKHLLLLCSALFLSTRSPSHSEVWRVQIYNETVLGLSTMVEMVAASAGILTDGADSALVSVNLTKLVSIPALTLQTQVSIEQHTGKVRILSEDRELLTASLATQRTLAGNSQLPSSLAHALDLCPTSRKAVPGAACGVSEQQDSDGYALYPGTLEAGMTVFLMTRQGQCVSAFDSLTAAAERASREKLVHHTTEAGAIRSAGGLKSCSIAGLRMDSIRSLYGHATDVPSLQLLWQPIRVDQSVPRNLRFLVLSLEGCSLPW